MVRSILVPLDGSSFAEHALPLALTIARRAKASVSLVLVHVELASIYSEVRLGMETAYDPAIKKQENAYLTALAERIRKATGLTVRTTLAEGRIVEGIQEQVKTTAADLVVLTTHGRGAFARFWMGSIADELVRQLAIPVLAVKPHDGLPDLAQEVLLRHILIPLDGSPLAEQAIEPAVALGGLAEAAYTLLRVVKPAIPTSIDYVHTPPATAVPELFEKLRALHQEEVKQAEDYLDGVSKGLAKRSLRAENRVVSADQPASAILEEVSYAGAHLIALTTHGRRGLGRLFLGSVADKVVRGSQVPVLVYRPSSK